MADANILQYCDTRSFIINTNTVIHSHRDTVPEKNDGFGADSISTTRIVKQ